MMNYLEELSSFIFTSKYARHNDDAGRRETWGEAVTRLQNMHLKRFKALPDADKHEIRWAFDMVREKRVVPSMRSMQFGGKAIETKHERIFNCAVRHVDSLRAFSEILHLLLCGNGVGIGVSKKYLKRLSNLVTADDKTGTVLTYVIEDTIEGWADSIEALLSCYFKNTPYTGRKISFDYSKIRKKGAPLKTGGGKAPGYSGLKAGHIKIKHLLDTVIEKNHQQRLSSINAYDILMHCSDMVLSGGVRRSATIVIFDSDDTDMLNAKVLIPVKKLKQFEYDKDTNKYEGNIVLNDPAYPSNEFISVALDKYSYEKLKTEKLINWFYVYPHRARSNNTIRLIRDKVTYDEFKMVLERTKQFGEPGFAFVNNEDVLLNPCAEVGFIPITSDGRAGVDFCNLSSINGALVKSLDDFLECAKAASIIGTLQASYTHFPYLSNAAKELTEEEALLGVSITGMMDNPKILLDPNNQDIAAKCVVGTNKKWAAILGINQAARTTLIKPEGTSSLILGSASGIHPHHARRYFRRVQVNKSDPVYQYFKKTNPHMCEESVWSANKTDDVITFVLELPDNVIIKSDLTAIEHLNIIKSTQQHWVGSGVTEANKKDVSHNVSCTVIVGPDEWETVTKYLFDNKGYFTAVALLPATGDKDYQQAPLEAIRTTEDELLWNKIVEQFKPVNYKNFKEDEDSTSLQQELVCAGGQCELPILSN